MGREEVDIAIVGAGPGGLCAAISAARSGASVVVLDKKKVIGQPVRCGEFFAAYEEMRYLLPHAKDIDRLFTVPREVITHECRRIRFFSPYGTEYEFPFRSYTLDRTAFEALLADQAKELGARIELQSKTSVNFHGDSPILCTTSGRSFKPGVVVAADGFPSETAASFGLPVREYITPRTVAVNYQYSMRRLRIEPGITEMYYDKSVSPGGYAWIIPKGNDAANVGTGIRTAYHRENARPLLEHFIDSYHTSSPKLKGGLRDHFISDVLPVDGPIARTWGHGVLACGDAAAMVMPTNGGGIQTAMVTGKIAGEVAAGHLQDGVSLSQYEDEWKRQIGDEMKASRTLRRAADLPMYKNVLFEDSTRILGVRGIRDTVTCRIPGRLRVPISVLAALMS